ncbi:hypothetical protein WDD9_004767 [Paenibacillus melissococcoides]|uniref:hypothetical protein n=1 Tax=Paenibacillus melissococcoides TaxID=2912268 RepID=UPI0021C424CB|nr:hypothetical protein [Paenibacillus melissococcoides]CAH8716109.1 hypothetical protein HTL2_004494 [Paenibacillus melissococcoides]CAH8717093.1 hypothetical protein WDD9_004767 [Paenibacillus melissococcoides]
MANPGLYPDLPAPVDPREGIVICPGQWRALWITAEIDERWACGRASAHGQPDEQRRRAARRGDVHAYRPPGRPAQAEAHAYRMVPL